MLKFLFYASRVDLFTQEIAHIRSLILALDSKLYITDDSAKLTSVLPRLENNSTVVILFAATNKELEELVNVKELFKSLPIILVIPDDLTDTMKLAISMQPHYFITKQESMIHLSLAIDELFQIYGQSNEHIITSAKQFQNSTETIS